MNTTIISCWIVGSLYLAINSGLYGQVAGTQSVTTPVAQSQSQVTLQAFQQEQQALLQERGALAAQGATQDQMVAWQQQNAGRLAAQQQRAQAIATASALQPLPMSMQPNLPANASQALTGLLASQYALTNARAQIHNALIQSMASNSSAVQVSQMQQQEELTFQQQHAGDVQSQAQQAQTLAIGFAQLPLPIPSPTVIPADAPPELSAYLSLHDQFMQQQMQLWNQYINSDPSSFGPALQQWQLQNANLIQQLQQAAQVIATTQN